MSAQRLSRPISTLLVLTVLTTLAMPSIAWADRSTSLQGNRLIEDADDIYTYPHALGQYSDRLTLDVAGAGQGNAAFLVDAGGWAWGVALHRGNLFDASSISRLNELRAAAPLGYPDVDTTGTAGFVGGLNAPLTAADVLLSFGDLGLRVGLGGARNNSSPPAGGENTQSATFASLALSYGLGQGPERWDIALHTSFITADSVAAGQTAESGSILRAAATTRGYIGLSEDTNSMWRLGVLGRVGFHSQSVDVPPGVSFTRSSTVIDLAAGAGPAITIKDRAKIGAYATLGMANQSNDPNSTVDNDSSSSTTLLLPGANVAMEIKLKDWLYVRAGAEYNHALLLTGQLDMAGETTGTATAAGFDWHAGVGLAYEGFTLDGTLSSDYLTQGPDFIGGDAALFALVSLGYQFGAAAKLGAPAAPSDEVVQARPEPPAARPQPTPAPVRAAPVEEDTVDTMPEDSELP